jgi:hypothetical protein
MMMAKAKVSGILEAIEIEPLRVGSMQVWIKGSTPLICNRMAAKGAREILFPSGPKGTAEKQQTLKHDPLAEYRNSMSVRPGTKGATRIVFPAPAVKGAMATAALETRGTNKTQIGRLVWVEGYSVDVFGVPALFMAIVRNADKNRTPDVRTRAILPEWAIQVNIKFVRPQLSEKAILQLLANGGLIVGVGDFRQEKGKGSFGQFCIATEAECKSIVKAGGMKAQDAAIKEPAYFDSDTAELMGWFLEEIKNRGKQGMLAKA